MNKTIFSIALAMIMAFLNCQASGQNNDSFRMENMGDTICLHRIVLDSIYYESALVYNTQSTRVSGLAVDAAIELFDYDSYVRLILVDEDTDTEYLVFDAYYPKNKIDTMFNISQYAHETTSLFNITTTHLKIEVNNAVCAIENIYYSDKYNTKTPEQYYADKLLNKSIQDSIILECINHRLRQENKIWVAGNTSLLQMTYDQRKAILPKNENYEIPNLQGFEYYIGGVFDLQPYDLNNRARSSYVDDFDWRDRHGQNWTTVAKNQSTCGSCWAFAPISAAENVINLYYNRHLDYDLSEQQLLSCSNAGDCISGQMPTAINYLLNNGVVSENCFPYVNSKVPCNNICSNPDEHIAFSNAPSVNIGTDNIKQTIINNGSICIKIASIRHYMAVCGFKLLNIGDKVYDGTDTILSYSHITIGPNSPYIGQNCWLFKNSWGTTWGNDGFGYVITGSNNLFQAYKLVNPISDTLSYQDIICEDQDGDGYYNWGIGPKPATCPDCPDECDCDDSDPTLGPYDNQYGCVSFCESGFINTPLYINGTTTWNTPRQINRDIIIQNGATLNICNTTIWELSADCSIIIHPGGRLVLDGATITNPCGILWKGIEVWGNSMAHQFEVNGSYQQGYLELKNGAAIENAVCAVELWHPGVTSTTGGIVHADSAFFINNAMAVHALNYTNLNPYTGHEADYNASFKECTFAVDGDYTGTEIFREHVKLDHVGGIAFSACSFSLAPTAHHTVSDSHGITSVSAGFSVTPYSLCAEMIPVPVPCPDSYTIHSSFTGFHDGIYAVQDNSNTRSFTVTETVFTGNNRGIYARNTGYAAILQNTFSVGRDADCAYGIYADGVASFYIEENTFTPHNTDGDTYGIGIFNSQAVNDIYLNGFFELTCGNLAVGQNTESSGGLHGGRPANGLTYTCNHNTDNLIDFCVLKEGGSGGIQRYQGSASTPAGNTFDDSDFHFYNDGVDAIDYHYDAGDPDQVPGTTLVYGVNRLSSLNSNSCLAHYGSVIKSAKEKSALEDEYLEAREAYDRLLAMLDKTPQDDPSYAGLAATAAEHSHRWHLAAGDIVRSDLMDGTADPEELRTWLGVMGDIASDRIAVASYMQEGDFKGAMALAETLPELYGLQGDALTDHDGYMRLLGLYRTLHESGRTTAQMTDDELDMVRDIADNGTGVSRSMALTLLESGGGRALNYACPTLPSNRGNGDGKPSGTGMTEDKEDAVGVTVRPNPARSQATFDYTLPGNTAKATLTLTNALGATVLTATLEGENGSKTLSLEGLPPGIYGYTVQCNGGLYNGRLIVN